MAGKEMVLFPNEDQFNEKTNELLLDECYWTIPKYPQNKNELIGSKIYFYDKQLNVISIRATITNFGFVEGKKTVTFELREGDKDFSLDLKNYPKRIQTRGWAYKWWN